MMLSPLDMAWKLDWCGGGGDDDFSSDDDEDGVESFSDRGNGSATVGDLLFRLRLAILDDGGIGWSGIGRMSLVGGGGLAANWTPESNAGFSDELSAVVAIGRTTGASVIGKVETGNIPRLQAKWGWGCGCGGCGSIGTDGAASVWTWRSSSMDDEFMNCKSKG